MGVTAWLSKVFLRAAVPVRFAAPGRNHKSGAAPNAWVFQSVFPKLSLQCHAFIFWDIIFQKWPTALIFFSISNSKSSSRVWRQLFQKETQTRPQKPSYSTCKNRVIRAPPWFHRQIYMLPDYCFPLLLLPLWLTWLQAWPRTFVRNEVCELNFLWFWKLMEHHGIWHTKIIEYIYIYSIYIYNISIYGSYINSYIYIAKPYLGAVMNII